MSKGVTKLLSVFLALVMLFQLTGVTQLTAYATETTGEERSETLETETTEEAAATEIPTAVGEMVAQSETLFRKWLWTEGAENLF